MEVRLREKNVKEVQKVLGEPFWYEFQDSVIKIRRNLLITSIVTIAVFLGDLHIDPGSTIFGLKFTGLTDDFVKIGLSLITIYFFVHFLWCGIDSFFEWRARVTGTKVAFVTTGRFAGKGADYPNDPRQSTLYNWWLDQAHKISNISETMNKIEYDIKEWDATLKEKYNKGADSINITNACSLINRAIQSINELKRSIKNVEQTLKSNRIPASLERFDNWFKLLLKSQNLRWLFIEFLLPLSLGGFAIFLMVKSYF